VTGELKIHNLAYGKQRKIKANNVKFHKQFALCIKLGKHRKSHDFALCLKQYKVEISQKM
jgi:hypothetical protein